MKTEINVGRDFSPIPAGRYEQDGPFSGEAFRRRFLAEAIRSNTRVTVDLSGTDGYGSSFLEEAFGGLVKEFRLSPREIKAIIKLETTDPRFQSYIQEAYSYLDKAAEEVEAGYWC